MASVRRAGRNGPSNQPGEPSSLPRPPQVSSSESTGPAKSPARVEKTSAALPLKSPAHQNPSRVSGSTSPGSISLFRGSNTFRECVRQRLLGDVLSCDASVGDDWRVMILDEYATHVVSSIVGMYDITEARVTVVEDINKQRQPFVDMHAIYILAPVMSSVAKLKADFRSKNEALYANAHLCFLEVVPDNVMASLRECSELVRRVKSFKEININFILAEVQAFHFQMGVSLGSRGSFSSLYRHGDNDAINKLTSKLVTLCCTLKEYPYVRYSSTSQRAELAARDFQDKMNNFIGGAKDWNFHGQDNRSDRGRSTLIVIDRTDDPLSPLMHEFTYQCLVQEFFSVTNGRIEYDVSESVKKEAVLNEHDDLWVELRHLHIGKVLAELDERFKEVMRNNSETAALARGEGKNMTLEQMAQATRNMPQFQEKTKKMSQHIKMAQACSSKISATDLGSIGILEQIMALGYDEVGTKRTKRELLDGWTIDGESVTGLLSLLRSSKVPPEFKVRLLGIFIITQKGITKTDQEELFSTAQLSKSEAELLQNLEHIGVHVGEPSKEPEAKTGGFMFSRKVGTKTSHVEENHDFTLMRYTCPAKSVVEKLVNDELPIEEFPSVLPLPESKKQYRKDSSTPSGKSARRQNRDRALPPVNTAFTGSRTIVFFLGGVCFSEMRAMYELMATYGKEIVIGGTSITAPKDFLEELKQI